MIVSVYSAEDRCWLKVGFRESPLVGLVLVEFGRVIVEVVYAEGNRALAGQRRLTVISNFDYKFQVNGGDVLAAVFVQFLEINRLVQPHLSGSSIDDQQIRLIQQAKVHIAILIQISVDHG